MADFSIQTINTRRSWKDLFQALRENNFQPRLGYPAKLSFQIEGEMKNCHNKQQLKEFMTTKLSLQKIFKGILNTEEVRLSQENARQNIPYLPSRLASKK
jgi:hypothetical protein